jgi:FtsP/CotA-like multicopper oxidase with cupredoxin domain
MMIESTRGSNWVTPRSGRSSTPINSIHSFHIHQTAVLVTEINGVSQDEQSLRDTFSVPPAADTEPSVLKVVIPFTDPVITGRFVYHCHAVDHEDKGMMGIIQVVASASELTDGLEHCRGNPRR